jgi:hypothetical protein
MNDEENITIYQVGGSIRDQNMGTMSNKVNYAVEAESYETMKKYLIDESMNMTCKEGPRLRAIDADLLSGVSRLKMINDMHIENKKMYISKMLRNNILDTIEVACKAWPSDEMLTSKETQRLCGLLTKKTMEVVNIPIEDKRKISDVLGYIEKTLKGEDATNVFATLLVVGMVVYKTLKETGRKERQSCADILHLLFEDKLNESDVTAKEDRVKLCKAGLRTYSHSYNNDGARIITLGVVEGSMDKFRAELRSVLEVDFIDNTVRFRTQVDAIAYQDSAHIPVLEV